MVHVVQVTPHVSNRKYYHRIAVLPPSSSQRRAPVRLRDAASEADDLGALHAVDVGRAGAGGEDGEDPGAAADVEDDLGSSFEHLRLPGEGGDICEMSAIFSGKFTEESLPTGAQVRQALKELMTRFKAFSDQIRFEIVAKKLYELQS